MIVVYSLLIVFAWFIEMPLWLQITTTVLCGLLIVAEIVEAIVKEIIKNKYKNL